MLMVYVVCTWERRQRTLVLVNLTSKHHDVMFYNCRWLGEQTNFA